MLSNINKIYTDFSSVGRAFDCRCHNFVKKSNQIVACSIQASRKINIIRNNYVKYLL